MKKKHSFVNCVVGVFYNERLASVNSYDVQNGRFSDRYFCNVQNIILTELSYVNVVNSFADTSVYDCNNFWKNSTQMSGSFFVVALA